MNINMINLPKACPRSFGYGGYEMLTYGKACADAALEAAAQVLTEYKIPVGNSSAGELACEWTYDALKECRDAIRALKGTP